MKRANFLAALLLVGGCAGIPDFPEPNREWRTVSGQLQYVTPENRLIGEFVASFHGSDLRLDFSKSGPVPLIRVSRSGEFARAEGALARGRWRGSVDSAPLALRGWLIEVPNAFAKLSSSRSPQRVEVAGARPGEKFVFVFAR